MSQLHWDLHSEDDTVALGRLLAGVLTRGGVLFLEGDLGAGKTTLSRGLIQALGHTGAVKSPTYTLVEPYELPQGPVYHFDLYRLADPEELELIGIRDYFSPNAVCIVEWPEKGEDLIPEPDLILLLEKVGKGRHATLTPNSQVGLALAEKLAQNL